MPALTLAALAACAPPEEACDGVPVVTWGSFGEGFLRGSCEGCHAADAAERNGAPPGVTFDTVDDAWDRADAILARAAAEPPTMPPMGGTDADDRVRLRWWLRCGEPGT